jgi:hypothetical protein
MTHGRWQMADGSGDTWQMAHGSGSGSGSGSGRWQWQVAVATYGPYAETRRSLEVFIEVCRHTRSGLGGGSGRVAVSGCGSGSGSV